MDSFVFFLNDLLHFPKANTQLTVNFFSYSVQDTLLQC